MKYAKNKLNIFYFLFFFLSVFTLIPQLYQTSPLSGVGSKQVFYAEMAQSVATGNLKYGIFPYRTFFEIHHPGPVPWAEEFPIYVTLGGWAEKFLHLSSVLFMRHLSFFCFALLLFGFFHLGRELQKREIWLPAAFPWALPLLALWFPGLRNAATAIMPDIGMIALILLCAVFALKEKWGLAFFSGMLACLFKYYAIFSVCGIWAGALLMHHHARTWKQHWRVHSLLLAPLPSVLYLALVFYLKIPNPILEYRASNGIGHFGNLDLIFSKAFYARSFTWIFVKNPNLILGLSSLAGIWFFFKNATRPIQYFLFCLIASALAFQFVFASSFYVHEYYALQMSLWIAVLSSAFVCWMNEKLRATRRQLIYLAVFFVFASSNLFLSRKMTNAKDYIFEENDLAATQIQKHTADQDRLFIITDFYGSFVAYAAKREAWTMHLEQWDKQAQRVEEVLSSPALNKVVVFLRNESTEHNAKRILKTLQDFHFQRGLLSNHGITLPNEGKPIGKLWIFSR